MNCFESLDFNSVWNWLKENSLSGIILSRKPPGEDSSRVKCSRDSFEEHVTPNELKWFSQIFWSKNQLELQHDACGSQANAGSKEPLARCLRLSALQHRLI